MLVTLLGIATLIRAMQLLNAENPMFLTPLGDRDAGQIPAQKKRGAFNARDTIGNRDAGQTGAVIERRASNVGDAGGNRDAGHAGFVLECGVPILVTDKP